MDNPFLLTGLSILAGLILIALLAQMSSPIIAGVQARRTNRRLATLQALTVGSCLEYSGEFYTVERVMEIRSHTPGTPNMRRFFLACEGRTGFRLDIHADEQANRLVFATPQQWSGDAPSLGDDYSFVLNEAKFVRPERLQTSNGAWINYPNGYVGQRDQLILVPESLPTSKEFGKSRITLRFEQLGDAPWTLHLGVAVAPLSIKL